MKQPSDRDPTKSDPSNLGAQGDQAAPSGSDECCTPQPDPEAKHVRDPEPQPKSEPTPAQMPEPVLDGGTREIFARIVDGDRYAMNDFFTRYRGRVENLVAEMTGDFVLTKVEKDDLVQEVLHDLWRGYRSKFVPGMEGEVRALLSKIVNSKINDESRRWKTRKRSDHGEVSMHAGERSIDLSGAEKAPCKTAESSEFNELLKYNLSRLSEEHRRVLYLCIDRNLPLETVAHEMRITADAVSSMKRRALQALRRLMEDDGVTGSKID